MFNGDFGIDRQKYENPVQEGKHVYVTARNSLYHEQGHEQQADNGVIYALCPHGFEDDPRREQVSCEPAQYLG